MYNAITTLQTSLLKKTELRTLSLKRGPTNTAGKIIRYCILSYQADYGKQDSINKSVSIIIIFFFFSPSAFQHSWKDLSKHYPSIRNWPFPKVQG